MVQLKIAIIGQSPFAVEVYKLLRQNGHEISGVFTIPDKGQREDPLGTSLKDGYDKFSWNAQFLYNSDCGCQ